MLATLTALTLAPLTAAPTAPADTAETIARFLELEAEVRRDPPPEEITRGRHYVNSDERRHDLFHDAIHDRGGLLVGVGSGQNYVLAGWVNPDAMVVVDFDQVIVDVHQLFAVVFANTDSPEAFRDAWRYENRVATLRWFRDAFPAGPQRRAMRQLFLEYRDNLSWGFTKTLKYMGEQDQRTYLDDAEQFATVKRLVTGGRVLAVRGDFTGRRTLSDVARLAREAGMPISTLYLSNIEQYFPWDRGRYRSNMLDLPLDDGTVVLRTYGIGEKWAADHNYRYYIQSGTNFHGWLRDPSAESVRDLFPAGDCLGIAGFFEVTILPDEVAEHRRRKQRQEQERTARDRTSDSSSG